MALCYYQRRIVKHEEQACVAGLTLESFETSQVAQGQSWRCKFLSGINSTEQLRSKSCHDLMSLIFYRNMLVCYTVSIPYTIAYHHSQFMSDVTYLIPFCTYNIMNISFLSTSLSWYVRKTDILLLHSDVYKKLGNSNTLVPCEIPR